MEMVQQHTARTLMHLGVTGESKSNELNDEQQVDEVWLKNRMAEDRERFIRSEYPPEYLETYSKIHIGAAQADFWRVLVLQKLGGVYMDIDAHLVWFLGRIVKPEDQAFYVTIRGGDVSNYFFGSRPNNPDLEEMAQEIRKNIATQGVGDVWDTTGPGVFIRALKDKAVKTVSYRHSCLQGNFTNEYFQYIDKAEGKWIHAQDNQTTA